MKNSEYFGIIGTIWIASYKPDSMSVAIGFAFILIALLAFFAERAK